MRDITNGQTTMLNIQILKWTRQFQARSRDKFTLASRGLRDTRLSLIRIHQLFLEDIIFELCETSIASIIQK